MPSFTLRPADPDRDFAQLAAWFSILEEETTTADGLRAYYDRERPLITHQVAADARGELLGFSWAGRDRLQPDRVDVTLYVRPEMRGRGIGRGLYAGLERAMREAGAGLLRANIGDDRPTDRAFAERRGFVEAAHELAMALDLAAFGDRPYDALIARLQGEGFRFTSMAELGDTEEAQAALYALNETTGREILGGDGAPSWASFDDFRQRVCRAAWYDPAGQMVVIDAAAGAWAAMSAITRFGDTACNLHTGVVVRYRGRKLAQAVKVLALRYARDELHAATVRTHHNSRNLPIIAIDRKLGYVQTAGGTWQMQKALG